MNLQQPQQMQQMQLQQQQQQDMMVAAANQGPPFGGYPERPGEPDCSHFLKTGQCGFGLSCRYNHPPDGKQAAPQGASRTEYPERSGQPDCQYYLKTGSCKFGATCKYHHPKNKVGAGASGRVVLNMGGYPLRIGEKECTYYMRTGACKYGSACKFNHPPIGASGQGPTFMTGGGSPGGPQGAAAAYPFAIPRPSPVAPPYLPRLAAGPAGAYSPPLVAAPHQAMLPMPAWGFQQAQLASMRTSDGMQQPQAVGAAAAGYMYASPGGEQAGMVATTYPYHSTIAMPPHAPPPPLAGGGVLPADQMFPERPGQTECQYYMKTGDCKYGMACRFDHPRDRAAPSPTCVLSALGLPLRPGSQACPFYVRYGMCKFGATCKFDHPMMLQHGDMSHSSSASSGMDASVAPYPPASSTSAADLEGSNKSGVASEGVGAPQEGAASHAFREGPEGPVAASA